MNILTVQNIKKVYGDKTLFDNSSLGIDMGDRIGVVGINGAGKSTLLKIIAGVEETDEGEVIKMNNAKISFLPQTPVFEKGISILDYVTLGKNSFSGDWDISTEAKVILTKLGFTDFDKTCDTLSGGEKKKVALAECLVSDSDILILDEPTNHLDMNMIKWLEEYLLKYKGTLIIVSHDRYFLDIVVNKLVEIDDASIYTYESNYSGFLLLKNKRIEDAINAEKKRQNMLRIETAWIRRGARARSTKQKAHIKRYLDLKSIEAPKEIENVVIESVASRMGKKTIEINNISKSFEDRKLISDFTYLTLRNDRVGIVGENGCGKSTLLKMICGIEKPDSGSIVIGDTIKIGYFAQELLMMEEATLKERVIDYIKDVAEFINTPSGKLSASVMLERFLFDGPMQYTPISKLSGGEKRRLQLLRVIMDAPNVLILDEPTNDLDIATLTILEDFLLTFDGIVITVSHDRYFMDNVCDRILAFEDDGAGNVKIVKYEGNYSYYIEKKKSLETALDPAGQAVQKGTTVSGTESDNKSWKKREERPKFTYKEQKEFDTIEDDIMAIEERLAEIDSEMVKFSSDFVKLAELQKEKESKEKDLEYKMERWEYLTDLNEKIEAYKKDN